MPTRKWPIEEEDNDDPFDAVASRSSGASVELRNLHDGEQRAVVGRAARNESKEGGTPEAEPLAPHTVRQLLLIDGHRFGNLSFIPPKIYPSPCAAASARLFDLYPSGS